MAEEEDIALVLMMHANKKPKHGGSVIGHEYLRRDRQEAHERLMHNYFRPKLMYPERYF